jgi:predicted signal transduction protein with EAL and GGDEF domain
MTPDCLPKAPPPAHEHPRLGRGSCLALLDAIVAHSPGGARGTAVFLLDCSCPNGSLVAEQAWRTNDLVVTEAGRRIRAASPAWHRLLRGEGGEFIVIAQGLVDGAAVLGTAARLVHAFDDALQSSDLALCPDVSIGIAYAPQHGAHAQSLLAAAEAGLRESLAAVRVDRHTTGSSGSCSGALRRAGSRVQGWGAGPHRHC